MSYYFCIAILSKCLFLLLQILMILIKTKKTNKLKTKFKTILDHSFHTHSGLFTFLQFYCYTCSGFNEQLWWAKNFFFHFVTGNQYLFMEFMKTGGYLSLIISFLLAKKDSLKFRVIFMMSTGQWKSNILLYLRYLLNWRMITKCYNLIFITSAVLVSLGNIQSNKNNKQINK